MKKTEQEIRAERCREAAKLFPPALFRFRVSIPAEPGYPELDIPADNYEQARARYDAACGIRYTPHEHRITEPETAKVELMESATATNKT